METAAAPRHPELLALSFVATPVIFFTLLALGASSLTPLALPFMAWSIAALSAAVLFYADSGIREHLSSSEQLAILAGHAFLAMVLGALSLTIIPLL